MNAKQYTRIAKFNLDEVLPFIGRGNPPKMFADRLVRMNSVRYQVFKTGTTCKACGIEGAFFALEKDRMVEGDSGYHFNLYALSKDGEEVLMTKDHILPKSKGGSDKLTNLQTMCIRCNNAKGNTIDGKKQYLLVNGKTKLLTIELKQPKLNAGDLMIVFKEHQDNYYFEKLIHGKEKSDKNRRPSTRTQRVPAKQRKKTAK
jgi:5-methylcytosine-specific restriction endonuclease McrA